MSTISRNLVVKCWGTPNATVGSVNEPRELEEHGHRFTRSECIDSPTSSRSTDRTHHLLESLRFRKEHIRQKAGMTEEDVSRVLASQRDRRYHHPAAERRQAFLRTASER
jgi:hypothetical protein